MADAPVTISIIARNLAGREIASATAQVERLGAAATATAGAGGVVAGAGGGGGAPGVGGFGGLGLAFSKFGQHAEAGTGSLRRLSSALALTAASSLNVQGPLLRLSEGLLIFGGGHGAVLALGLALGALALATKLFGGEAGEAEKKLKALEAQLHKTFVESLPDYVKYATQTRTLSAAVADVGVRYQTATNLVAYYADQLRAGATLTADGTDLQHAYNVALAEQNDLQPKLNAGLHALGEARGLFFRSVREHVETLRTEAEAVFLSAGHQAALRIETMLGTAAMSAQGQELIRQATYWANLRVEREKNLEKLRELLRQPQHRPFEAIPGTPELAVPGMPSGAALQAILDKDLVIINRFTASFKPPPVILTAWDAFKQRLVELNHELQSIAREGVGRLGTAFADMFQAAFEGSRAVGREFLKSMGQAIAGVARMLGQMFFAEGVAALARSLGLGFLFPGAGAASAVGAGKFFLAAGLMFALSGGIGAAAGGGGGGGGGGAGGFGGGGAGFSQGAVPGEARLIIEGDRFLDTTDPAQMQRLADAIQALLGRKLIIEVTGQ